MVKLFKFLEFVNADDMQFFQQNSMLCTPEKTHDYNMRSYFIHNLFYTLRVYIQYNKICSNSKLHGTAKALNFTNKC